MIPKLNIVIMICHQLDNLKKVIIIILLLKYRPITIQSENNLEATY